MLSNFTPYRYSGPALVASLSLPAFTPCVASQCESIGFVPNEKHLIVRIERKAVPSQMLNRRVDELAAQIEETTGRKPGKKQRTELKEQAHAELIVRAFPKRHDVQVTFMEEQGLLLIGATSSADTEAITALLVASQEGLQISLLLTTKAPTAIMSGWLHDLDDVPGEFRVGRDCVLAGTAEGQGKVTYRDHALDCENVSEHLVLGKVVEALELDFKERVSFTLTDGLQFKSVKLGDLAFEGHDPDAHPEEADAELFLWRAELAPMLDAVIDAFDGVAQ